MANQVFANGREVSCKSADGKTICAFPDVCLSPPSPPAGPIPIPYPNTGFATDTANGSKTVKISGKEVMLKDKSYFKKSTGDEPATRTLGMGVITHTITGKVYFKSWSMDVKFEGENVDRHLDVTTHNHNSDPGQTPPWPYADTAILAKECNVYAEQVSLHCPPPSESLESGKQPGPEDNTSPACCEARKCMLVPYSPVERCSSCGGKTPHHPVPVADLSDPRKEGQSRGKPFFPQYNHNKAPCICVEGKDHNSREGPTAKLMQHGRIGRNYVIERNKMLNNRENFSYSEINGIAAQAVADETGCDKGCLEAQLERGHKNMGVDVNAQVMRKGEVRAPRVENKPQNPNPV